MADTFQHETERLILRDWREEDWAPFWGGTNTPAVMEWLGGVLDEEGMTGARARLESYHDQHGHTFWPVIRKEDQVVLGFCGLKRTTDKNGPFGAMEVGWRLAEEAWGKGYAKEAAIASLDLAFDKFGADEVVALTVQSNQASWGLMLRLGMTHRPDLDFEEGGWNEGHGKVIVYAITQQEWAANRG